ATQTDALASLVDVLPTVLRVAGHDAPDGLRGEDLTPILAHAAARDAAAPNDGTPTSNGEAVDFSAISAHPSPAPAVRDAVHFTYDDHQAATAMQNAPGQPNRIRSVRTPEAKYAVYFDPDGREQPEYELYDLTRDPYEVVNLVDVHSGAPGSA